GAILTKESGLSGGFPQKLEAAKALNIPVLVIAHPSTSDAFIPVTGVHTLRREIEKRLPDFFDLKTGYTTGTCATAAAKAALYALLTGNEPAQIPITLPDGETLTLPILDTDIQPISATCTVRKDGGDDPDVTHGIEIRSTVELSPIPGIRFLQGEGVGKVTLPGIGIPVGEPAINRTPRAMMESEIRKLLDTHDLSGCGVHVTVSVPKGREIAARTFNPRLGIQGGISIIGTSGIVKPFSSEAFLGAIQKQMEIALALHCERIVINSGAKSEGMIKKIFPEIPEQAFVHFGNFVGETIRIAAQTGIKKLTLGIMVGKAVKLAEGHLDTHSKHTAMNREFLKQLAREAGYGEDTGRKIDGITLARQLWELFPETGSGFWQKLLGKCYEVCFPLFSSGNIDILLIGEKGEIIPYYNWNSHT
ncbi:MAG: cobalt-precorrin-5B (C(1))-methyltransferase CbiD, partial [Rikenellaceae bacterium]|nr:cobalt-precorrin-5B (C(1))-methyltransferase CbiD [Rikenellaceae bacterium]